MHGVRSSILEVFLTEMAISSSQLQYLKIFLGSETSSISCKVPFIGFRHILHDLQSTFRSVQFSSYPTSWNAAAAVLRKRLRSLREVASCLPGVGTEPDCCPWLLKTDKAGGVKERKTQSSHRDIKQLLL